MTDFECIDLEIDSRDIAWLTLQRPDTHNALDARMIEELTTAARMLDERDGLRAIVLSGSGKSFCAGGDLKWMKSNFGKPRHQMVAESAGLATMLASLNNLKTLLIGRINGPAYGGGVGMISVCDIAIAAASAKFCLTEVTLGLTPANISPYVVARMGTSWARRTFLNARPFSSEEAVRFGLIHDTVADENLDAAIKSELDYAMRCAPGAAEATKAMINYVASHDIKTNRLYTADRLADAWETAEGQEGVRCFFDRTAPSWRAKS